MFWVLGSQAQQKREYLNVFDSVSTIDGSDYIHYQKYTKKVYRQNGVSTPGQVSIKIANLVQDSVNCEDAIVPLRAQYISIKNNAEVDSVSKVSRLNKLKQRYNTIQDELNDIELRKIQEQKLLDALGL